ncbi:MAG: hypothetical protein ABI837_06650, partial [Acidobacteriota bacterium]
MEELTNRHPFGRGMSAIYYLLVAFNILTILVSLYLNNQLALSERLTLAETERSATQLARISELELAAGKVDSPGNQIFTSGDVATERARLQSALRGFREAMRLSRRSLADGEGDRHSLAALSQADELMTFMVRETETIFRQFEQGRLAEAGLAMAAMDREYSSLRTELSEVRAFLRNRQFAEFRARSRRNHQLGQQQTGSVVLLGILLIGL